MVGRLNRRHVPSRMALTAGLRPSLAALTTAIVAAALMGGPAAAQGDPVSGCPGGGNPPTPTAVAVATVPIVVTSTTDDYFVLYARSADQDGWELPVAVVRGQAGTTTLAENVEALAPERYRVEKYLVSDPADVDGDCIDDITELGDPANKNPINPAPAIAIADGAVSVPDMATLQALYLDAVGNRQGKFVVVGLGTDRPSVYFMNVNTHRHHSTFVDRVDLEWNEVLDGSLVYDPDLTVPGGRGAHYFWMDAEDYTLDVISEVFALLAASMPLIDQDLVLYVPNFVLASAQPALTELRESRIDLVFNDDIFSEVKFLALNPGVGFGRLRSLEPDDRPHPRDIVLYEALPNELPRVAGIVSTVPQTPLSHVNLRAKQDRVPNAFVRNALDKHTVTSLLGDYVRYEVADNSWSVRAATPAEVDAHHASRRPAAVQVPQRDLSVTTIKPLSQVGFSDWDAFGVKAANVAVLRTLGFPQGTVPDGFAVPFYFYDEFMKANSLYNNIDEMLADDDFQNDFDEQADKLKKLRKKIKDADTPQFIIDALTAMHATYPEGQSLRYRSSTNNEDLPGFNGAGLYDSKTQKPDETTEDGIDKSLKQVFASLWNFRAFTEREFHRIDHKAAAMGVLVHPNYTDELANGVAVSFNPVHDDSRYYVNTQLGEDLVTNPQAHSVPEELLLASGGGRHVVLGTSNLVPTGQLLMSADQINQLRRHLRTIHDRFKQLYRPASGEPFAMEIEFKITSADKLAIKQARPWVFDIMVDGANEAPVTVPDTNVNEGPEISGRQSLSFAENQATDRVLATYSATDPEDPSAAITRWRTSGADGGDFVINALGELRFRYTPNYERPADSGRDNEYNFSVRASDGRYYGYLEVTVTVTDVNEPPAVTGTDTFTYRENGTAAVHTYRATDPERREITWSVSGPDGDDFAISEAGVLSFASPPNHARPADSGSDNVYEVTVMARDDASNPASLSVTVTVTNVNEGPKISGRQSLSFAENQATGRVLATYSATDPEDPSAAITRWRTSGADGGDFVINALGELRFRYTPDYERPADSGRDNEYNFSVRASDGRYYGYLEVTVTVTDVNEPPAVTGTDTFTYRENGTAAVHTYRATDPERREITWSVSGPDGDDFAISEAGVLSFASPPNHERPADSGSDNVYEVTVMARDDASNPASLSVTVTVTNVNEGPEISGRPIFTIAENHGLSNASYTGVDPEGGTVTRWTVGGRDGGDFNITQGGTVYFRNLPDYERPADSNRDNVYEVVVRAYDGRVYGSFDVTVTVTDVNEPPEIGSRSRDSFTQRENRTSRLYTYSATDPERSTVTWSVTGTDGRLFTIDERGQFSFDESSPPDFDAAADVGGDNIYNVTIQARDPEFNTASLAVTVTVTEVNEGPVISRQGNAAGSVRRTIPRPRCWPLTRPRTRSVRRCGSPGGAPRAATAATSSSMLWANCDSGTRRTMSGQPTRTETTCTS